MPLTVTRDERAAREAAQGRRRVVRPWRRYQAVLLRADGVSVAAGARALKGTETSVSHWTAAWRTAGVGGVAEGAHPGQARCLDPAGAAAVDALLRAGDPQAHGYVATGWTVALRRTALSKQGWAAGERTSRRARHRLGWRWQRPQFVLGRPDPAYPEHKSRR